MQIKIKPLKILKAQKINPEGNIMKKGKCNF